MIKIMIFVSPGAWQLRDGPDLRWTEGDNWRATVELPGGTVYEYKYVLLDSYSGHALSWQRGNNSVLAVKSGEESVEVRVAQGGTKYIAITDIPLGRRLER